MEINIKEYKEDGRNWLMKCIENLQKYIVEIDPLHRQMLSPRYAREYTERLLEAVKEKQGKIYFAETAGKIVGFVAGTIQPEPKGGTLETIPSKPAWIRELYVDSEFRGKGVGTLLMKTLEEYFKEKECDVILVGVFAPNTEAHSFYESNGYVDRDITMLKRI